MIDRRRRRSGRGRRARAAVGNLLNVGAASLETDATGWVAYQHCTLARSTEQSADGKGSLKVTASGGGDPLAYTLDGVAGAVVSAATQYTCRAEFRAATQAREVRVGFDWYRADGTYISSAAGANVNDTTTGWTVASHTATSPALAAFADVYFVVVGPAASEVHYLDRIGIFAGASNAWNT
jgi:hypothetical protein